MTTFNFTRKLAVLGVATVAVGLGATLTSVGSASANESVQIGVGELHEYTVEKHNAQIQEISGLKMEVDFIELKGVAEVEYKISAAR